MPNTRAPLKSGQFSRAKRILTLVPRKNADSDKSDGKSSDDEIASTRSSSPAPSLASSLEDFILDSSSSDNYVSNSDNDSPSHHTFNTSALIHSTRTPFASQVNTLTEPVCTPSLQQAPLQSESDITLNNKSPYDNDLIPPLTPTINEVFTNDLQCNYDAIPSISSLPSLPSNQASPITLPTRQTRNKHPALSIVVSKAKRQKKPLKMKINFERQKTNFQHSAEINHTIFKEPVPDNWSAVDYFYRFFPKNLIDLIAVNTNLYSVQQSGRSINVTSEEICDFLAINILMGVVSMPSYRDYWSTSYRYDKIAKLMTLNRFQKIRRYIHFTDNCQADTDDRYYKLRPLIDCVRAQCLSVEEENVYSIDEMIIPYKGKKAGSRKQYNPNKPCKWGFKNLVRAGVSGIIYDYMLYGGDDTFRGIQFEKEEETLGVSSKTVLALCKTIKQPASVVFFDNWFSSLELIYILRENYGIFSLGTMRKNRLRDANKFLLSDKQLEKKGRGSFCQVVCNKQKISIVKWYDNKPVILASSFVDAHPVSKIKRYNKESKGRVDISCPNVVKHYNRHMGGVDLSDMLISLYRTGIKSNRWYMNIFSQIIDICVNNAWLLRRRHYKQANIKKNGDHLKKFRYEVFVGLTKGNRITTEDVQDSVPNAKKIKKPVTERPLDVVRYDRIDHWPKHDKINRCKYCKKGQASTICTKCNVHLCYVAKRNCFLAYHVKE